MSLLRISFLGLERWLMVWRVGSAFQRTSAPNLFLACCSIHDGLLGPYLIVYFNDMTHGAFLIVYVNAMTQVWSG